MTNQKEKKVVGHDHNQGPMVLPMPRTTNIILKIYSVCKVLFFIINTSPNFI